MSNKLLKCEKCNIPVTSSDAAIREHFMKQHEDSITSRGIEKFKLNSNTWTEFNKKVEPIPKQTNLTHQSYFEAIVSHRCKFRDGKPMPGEDVCYQCREE